MYMGSLIMAAVVESSQLHKRIALVILKNVGTNPRLLMLGKDMLSVSACFKMIANHVQVVGIGMV